MALKPALTPEEQRKQELLNAVKPTVSTPNSPSPTAAKTAAPTQPAAPAQPKPQPLATPTPDQVQANLPGLAVGQQTRGAGAVRLDRQTAPAGKELIGMRSGVPIYADATDVYSSQVEKLTPTAPVGSTPAMPSRALQITKPPAPSTEALREQYQKDAVAARQEIEQKYKQPEQPKYFSKQYADQFTAAQAAANQRAKERIAYGGQPVRDTSNSMAIANNAAAALRNIASAPKTASMEELKSYGFDKDTEKRLSFGVGPNGESLNVTSDYLKDYAASLGLTGPTTQNSRLRPNRSSSRIFRRPGF